MKIACLTSSRADYGIYLPLLEKLRDDAFFDLEIVAFGTHLSSFHGYTLQEIEKGNYKKIHKISSLLVSDDPQSIVTSYGLTIIKFADFWADNSYDLVLCLGDRFEMSAAVQAGIPFGVVFAHLHGGETTLGAIDNIYRHQISLASAYHFTATDEFSDKVGSFTEDNGNIFTVGSLSLDNLNGIVFTEEDIFREKYGIYGEYALVTFHPETVAAEENKKYASQMAEALKNIAQKINVVITMPNADTLGSVFRETINTIKAEMPERFILIENFGKQNYFSAMKYAKFLLGNTSSGIIEAASFGKYVVNVGDRQKGRAQSDNIVSSSFDAKELEDAALTVFNKGDYKGSNVYYRDNVAQNTVNILKKIYEKL
jgi:GDP/UDP-N,N'-diacetylbacillosamine 2-epimerase (hydrolysing)